MVIWYKRFVNVPRFRCPTRSIHWTATLCSTKGKWPATWLATPGSSTDCGHQKVAPPRTCTPPRGGRASTTWCEAECWLGTSSYSAGELHPWTVFETIFSFMLIFRHYNEYCSDNSLPDLLIHGIPPTPWKKKSLQRFYHQIIEHNSHQDLTLTTFTQNENFESLIKFYSVNIA